MSNPLPPQIFDGSPEEFLSTILPEERYRVVVYHLMLLSRIRIAHSDQPDVLRVCALIEGGAAGLLPAANQPKKVAYGPPPPLSPNT